MLSELPGGQWISPHVNDGPWSIVAVTSYDEPSWQLNACLRAYPGIVPPASLRDEALSLHVVPAFIARMCQWHSVEEEALVDTETYGAALWEVRPSAKQISEHLAQYVASISTAADLTWQQDEDGVWLSSQAPCPGETPDADAYFIAQITTDTSPLRWRIDYYPGVTDMPTEGIATGHATSLSSAQQASSAAIARLLNSGSS